MNLYVEIGVCFVPQDISKHERHHMMVRVPCQAVVDIAIVEASDVRQVGAA